MQNPRTKMRTSSSNLPNSEIEKTLTLIPPLPNDLAALILAYLPYSHHARVKSTCKSWRMFLSSQALVAIRKKHKLMNDLLCVFPQDPSIEAPRLFDPRTMAWRNLPLMPCSPFVYGLCNFVAVAVDGSLYVIGGSVFDTRGFPIDRPEASKAVFRFDVGSEEWESVMPMLSARGSFACTVMTNGSGSRRIIVAGGGSRHNVFKAAGSKMTAVEMYDVGKDEWVGLPGLPGFRAGCVGFMAASGEDGRREFWVMGGYGEEGSLAGVVPVDRHCRDVVVMEVGEGGRWREIGDMWEEGERVRLGKIVVVDEDTDDLKGMPGIFMLDGDHIFRYDMNLNRWLQESSLPRKVPGSSFGFVALGGELHVLTPLRSSDHSKPRRSQPPGKVKGIILIQIYNPSTKIWRSLISEPPMKKLLDMNTAVMCSVHL